MNEEYINVAGCLNTILQRSVVICRHFQKLAQMFDCKKRRDSVSSSVGVRNVESNLLESKCP
jgi:hypothetical protein